MRVVTLNVWARGGDWPARRSALAGGFAGLGADLVALQETVVDGAGDQARDILGDEYELVHSQRRSADGMGVSIASRWPIADVEELSWKPQRELERELQAVQAAERLEELAGHVVVAGDFDADPDASSMRFWAGRQSLHGVSVCYRDAWARTHPGEPAPTFTPEENPLVADPDWPFRQIDHVLVRCGEHGGPTLPIRACRRIFDNVPASDHYGLLVELG
jgi:endonuclease/exonuclease/phosphatase family metal-dependent hydrolase